MRRQRRKQQWWAAPLGLILGIGMVFASIPFSISVHDHLSPWAAPLIWAALAIAALASIGYFLWKAPGWLVVAILGFTLAFSESLAFMEGWETQVQIGLTIAKLGLFFGSIVFVVVVAVWTWRINRRMSGALRTVGAEIRTDALFRDDGERILVQVDRGRLLRLIALLVVYILGCGAGFYWTLTLSANPIVVLALGALTVLLALVAALNVVRLMIRRPALVIGPDGLFDNASQIVTGRGLLRWDELLTVFEYTYKPGKLNRTQRMLGIILTDAAAVRKRQPMWKRALGFLGHGQLAGMLVVMRALLDRPPDALANEIKQYAKRHAPRGWDSPLIADDDETDERAEKQG